MIAAAKAVGHPGGHSLRPVQCVQYSQKLRMELPETVSAYEQALEKLEPAVELCAGSMEQPVPETLSRIRNLAEVVRVLLPWVGLPASWAKEAGISQYLTGVEEMAEHFLKAKSLRSRLSQTWNAGFFELDGQALLEEYNTVNAKWFLPKLLGMNGLVKRLAACSAAPVSKEQLPEVFARLAEYQREQRSGDALLQTYGSGLDNLYTGRIPTGTGCCKPPGRACAPAGRTRRRCEEHLASCADEPAYVSEYVAGILLEN